MQGFCKTSRGKGALRGSASLLKKVGMRKGKHVSQSVRCITAVWKAAALQMYGLNRTCEPVERARAKTLAYWGKREPRESVS